MLVFIDESGDTGAKLQNGSSDFFVITAIIFDNTEEAAQCEQIMAQARKHLGKTDNFEFHFAVNSNSVRRALLCQVESMNFTYAAVAIDKALADLNTAPYNSKEQFYEYTCTALIESILPILDQAHIIIDRSGRKAFEGKLRSYIRSELGEFDRSRIHTIKMKDSATNSLIQLADYCTSVCNRMLTHGDHWKEFYNSIKSKELEIIKFPK